MEETGEVGNGDVESGRGHGRELADDDDGTERPRLTVAKGSDQTAALEDRYLVMPKL